MDIQVAMAKAVARRMPLVILVLPSDVDAHDSVRATAGLPQMASIAVWHTVVQGTPEFDMLSAAAGGATAVPRIHLWPPQQRALPHATFSGEQFNTLDIRRAVLRASALVHTECETLRQQQADCSRALAKAATAVPRPSSAKPAVTQPQPVRPTSAAPTPTAAPKPAPNPAPAAPAPLTAAATSTVHVLAGKEIDQTLSLSNVRDNHTLTYFRKLVSAKLGHNNFHFQRRGQSLSSTEEERLIVGDLHDAGTPIPVHLSQAAVAMRNAKLAAEASGSSVASPTEAQSASPVEPKAQRGPMPETATSVARIDFVFPDSSVDTVEGPKTSTVSVYWARLSERLSSGSIKLVTASPGCPDEEVTFTDAHRVTLGDLLRFTKVTVRADVPKVEPVPPQDGAVKIRLVLPGGGEVTAAFAPSDSLSLVHSAASGAIDGDTNFYLQQPYPPKRYTVDDLTKSLENLGIRGNVTLRILRIATSDAQPPTDPNQPAKAGAMTGITSVVSGVASTSARFVGRLFGSGGGQPSSSAEAAAPPPAAPAPAPAARPAPRTMAEMRQREAEEEERRKAANGGANNYFGGDSTEFQAHPKKP